MSHSSLLFVIGDTLVTPPLSDSILDGVTRNSLLILAKDLGYKTEERQVSIEELKNAFKNKTITEAFGAGTAALVAPISTINIQGTDFHLPAYNAGDIMFQIKNKLDNIRYGIEEDIYNWNHII